MSGKSRLGPDPSISVSDLQKKIHEATQRQGCSDLAKLLRSKQSVSWKHAPDSEWLGTDELADVCSSVFTLHTNGVLQGSKLKKALTSLQTEKGRLNYTKMHDSGWADSMDEKIRIACSQYRELKKCTKKYQRCV